MRKFIYILLFINIFVIMIFTFTFRFKVVEPITNDDIKEREAYLNIATTNKLLYYMVKDITLDKHNVEYLFNNEEEQWNFQYSKDSLNNIAKKDIFIYNGASYEPWVNSFLEELNKNKVGIVNASRGIKTLYLNIPKKYKDKEIKENPYYWLSFEEYIISFSNVKNAIEEKDPKNREFYEENFSKRLKALNEKMNKFKEDTEKLGEYNFIVQGDSLDYFFKYTGLKNTKFNEYGLNPVEDEKLDKKIQDLKKPIFLYEDEEELKKYDALIKKHNLKTLPLVKYKFDLKYDDIIDRNMETLKSLLQ